MTITFVDSIGFEQKQRTRCRISGRIGFRFRWLPFTDMLQTRNGLIVLYMGGKIVLAFFVGLVWAIVPFTAAHRQLLAHR